MIKARFINQLRILMLLRTQEWQTCCELSREMNCSISSVEILIPDLIKAGLVESRRGQGGGYRRTAPLCEIRVADVANAAPLNDSPNQRLSRSLLTAIPWTLNQLDPFMEEAP